ncbi:hypothetical protein FRB94_006635 [Tulasnella sp. JGI-2019a]|nr:hypothetical protein FRB94_006635 [Tulasnella sp. JGI-2019a]
MLGLDNYGSDSDSDHDDVLKKEPRTTLQAQPKSSLLSALPPPRANGSGSTGVSLPGSSNAMNLPAPKAKNKKRDGPIKIKVESLKPSNTSDDEDQPPAKKPRLESNGKKAVGAGSSALLAMLPAPKKTSTLALPPPKMLGSGAGGSETGAIIETPGPVGGGSETQDSEELSFLPAFLRKPRNAPPPSINKPGVAAAVGTSAPPPTAAPELEEADFFSIGSKPVTSTARLPSSGTLSGTALNAGVSSAPVVKEYQPPDPTPYDPYPGYYELPSGEWRAYDPVYYKSHWENWQAVYSGASDIKGKGKDGRGWEGADNDDLATVDADEEMRKSNLAERERQKGLTAPPTIIKGNAPQVKQQKANGLARSRHQLSTLLTEAYENREAIEEKIAQGRRNRKEAGNKYGFA